MVVIVVMVKNMQATHWVMGLASVRSFPPANNMSQQISKCAMNAARLDRLTNANNGMQTRSSGHYTKRCGMPGGRDDASRRTAEGQQQQHRQIHCDMLTTLLPVGRLSRLMMCTITLQTIFQ